MLARAAALERLDLTSFILRAALPRAQATIEAPRETPSRILGFYTLSPASIEFSRTPSVVTRGLGRYEVPVYRVGRLAVDRDVRARGLGWRLRWRAVGRCLAVAREAGGAGLLIDAEAC